MPAIIEADGVDPKDDDDNILIEKCSLREYQEACVFVAHVLNRCYQQRNESPGTRRGFSFRRRDRSRKHRRPIRTTGSVFRGSKWRAVRRGGVNRRAGIGTFGKLPRPLSLGSCIGYFLPRPFPPGPLGVVGITLAVAGRPSMLPIRSRMWASCVSLLPAGH
jgi:hypothetical protein